MKVMSLTWWVLHKLNSIVTIWKYDTECFVRLKQRSDDCYYGVVVETMKITELHAKRNYRGLRYKSLEIKNQTIYK